MKALIVAMMMGVVAWTGVQAQGAAANTNNLTKVELAVERLREDMDARLSKIEARLAELEDKMGVNRGRRLKYDNVAENLSDFDDRIEDLERAARR